jgi:hypothetical protein
LETTDDTTDTISKVNTIELMEGGEGVWICCDREVKFSWYVKNNQLRIHTQEGGVMVGELDNNSFMMTLPGKKGMMFIRVPSEH